MCTFCYIVLTIVTVVINQNDLFDQVRMAFLQDTEPKERQKLMKKANGEVKIDMF